MRNAYPGMVFDVPYIDDNDRNRLFANLTYLQGHGLCEPLLSQGVDGHFSWGGAKITPQGLDFLEDDGGLSAILRTVTVKLHAETLTELLSARIDAADRAGGKTFPEESHQSALPNGPDNLGGGAGEGWLSVRSQYRRVA
jgi:hypothetical protein